MSFLLQLALSTATNGLHILIYRFGKWLKPEEVAAANLLIDAVVEIPQRIHDSQTPVPKLEETPPPGFPPDAATKK